MVEEKEPKEVNRLDQDPDGERELTKEEKEILMKPPVRQKKKNAFSRALAKTRKTIKKAVTIDDGEVRPELISIRKEYGKLTSGHKKKLILFLIATILPIAAYCTFSVMYLLNDKNHRLDEYAKVHNIGGFDKDGNALPDDRSEVQKTIETNLALTSYDNTLPHNPNPVNPQDQNPFYVSTVVGMNLMNISHVNNSGGTFDVEGDLWFDYDIARLENMVKCKLADDHIDWTTLTPDEFAKAVADHEPSNSVNFNFDLGARGNFEIAYPKVIESRTRRGYVGTDEFGDVSVRNFDILRLRATIRKKYDSPRFPIDSLQFKFHVRPEFDARYVRYNVLSAAQPHEDIQSLQSHLDTYIDVAGQYAPWGEKPLFAGIYYYDGPNPAPGAIYDRIISTEFMMSLVVNRKNPALFVQVFITLFAITIWVFIAFYDAAYNRVFKVSTLGTAMFGIISAIIIGNSLISEVILLSLPNLINIFGLAIILVTTLVFMRAKRIIKKGTDMDVIANVISVRMTFWALLLGTITVYAVLPLVAFIW